MAKSTTTTEPPELPVDLMKVLYGDNIIITKTGIEIPPPPQ